LIKAFEKTDELFLKKSERPQAGSTATSVLIMGKYVFVANVGDSRTIMSFNKGKAKRLSNDHKPNRSDEAKRIRDMGGFVIHGRIMGELAVSRAFGDAPFKQFEITEPTVPMLLPSSSSSSFISSSSIPLSSSSILVNSVSIDRLKLYIQSSSQRAND
jgi:serine/threonine protein phosphatase PrpC